MKDIGKILAGICAVLFVISGVIASLLFNIEQKTFSSMTYKQAFKEQGLYAQTPSLIAGILAEYSNNSSTANALLSLLNKDELALVISSLLPPADIEAITNDVLDSGFAFMNNESDSVMLSLLPLKRNLVGEGGVRAFTQILQAQPDCTLEQLFQIGAGLLSSNTTMMLCNPPPDILQLAMPLIEAQLQTTTATLPDQLSLVTSDNAEASAFRTRLVRIRMVMKWTPVLPLFLLIILTLFAVRSLNDWLMWWGIPFLITGMLGTFIAIIGAPLILFFIDKVILRGITSIPTLLLETIQTATMKIAGKILLPIGIQNAILAFVGLGMMIAFLLIRRKRITLNAREIG